MGFSSNRSSSTTKTDPRPADDDGDDLAELRRRCPSSTPAERERFLRAKGGDRTKALEQLSAHMAWRDEHGLDGAYHCSPSFGDDDDHDPDLDDGGDPPAELWYSCASDERTLDELDWRFAARAALEHERRTAPPSHEAGPNPPRKRLPQLARFVSSDEGGRRIVHFLPARVDLSAASDGAFALSVALYLERKLDRDSPEKITVALDVRGGDGWANPKPTVLLPFIRRVVALLERHCPERLAGCIVYPVPAAAALLWRVVRPWLDPATAEKIGLVRGDARGCAPPPFAAMAARISRPALEAMEVLRVASFAGGGEASSPSWEPPTRTTSASFVASAGESTTASSTTTTATAGTREETGAARGAPASAGEPTTTAKTPRKKKKNSIIPALIRSRKRWVSFR